MPDSFDLEEWDIPFLTPTKPRKAAPAPRFTGLESFSRLVAKKAAGGDLESFKAKARALPGYDTQTLIARLSTTTDALTTWALHCHLDKRNIAPAQRWPGNTSSDQMLFVTWCADLAWFIRRNPGHSPRFKSWRRLFTLKPCTHRWLEVAFWLFDGMSGRSLAYITAKALGLSDDHRQDLLTVPTQPMVAARREIEPAKFEAVKSCLLGHALVHRDKSGLHTPTDIANRRASLFRVHVLSGKRAPVTAKNWQTLSGETIARQTVSKHLDTILAALRSSADFE